METNQGLNLPRADHKSHLCHHKGNPHPQENAQGLRTGEPFPQEEGLDLQRGGGQNLHGEDQDPQGDVQGLQEGGDLGLQ